MPFQLSDVPGLADETVADQCAFHDYRLYGISLRSEIPLSYPRRLAPASPNVTISKRHAEWFSQIRENIGEIDTSSGWYEYAQLTDGSDFLRWPSLFEFVVSADGCHVTAGHLENATSESFQNYLLGWVLSFALVKQGFEPLHATAVVINGSGIAFLGTCGYGKSTLAASFINAGHKLLTDDLLLIGEVNGVLCGFPGPPRIKLFPHIAEQFQLDRLPVGPMNPDSDKVIIPLRSHQVQTKPVPMGRFVVLDQPEALDTYPRLERLSAHDSMLALIAATFNDRVRTADRLQRQFELSTVWADRIAVWRARYPRTLDVLAQVQRTIVGDHPESARYVI